MADLATEDRTFAGDPNAPPKAPKAPPKSAGAASAPAGGGGTAVPMAETETPAPVQSAAPAPAFRVYQGADGQRDVWMLTPDLESTKLGTVNISNDDAEKVLGAVGTYNAAAGTWDVPEDAAQSLLKGRLGFTDNIVAKFKSGEANMARNAIGAAYLSGTMSREDALARGHEELLKVQVGEQPALAWTGLGSFASNAIKAFKNPMKALRFATGEFAEQIPVLVGTLEAAAKGAVKGGAAAGAASAAALATGPVGLAAAGGFMAAGAEMGATYETWKYMTDTEAGSTALEMLEMGFEDAQVRDLAPLAGIIKGTLETASFGVMTAPLKRGFIGVLGKDTVKAALSKWYVSYAETIGAEVATEVAQTRVDQVTKNFAAQIENKPELLQNPQGAKDELWQTFVKTAAATMLMGAPGAAVDVVLGHTHGEEQTGAVKPAEAANLTTAAEREQAAAAPSPQQAHVEAVVESFNKGEAPAEELIRAVEAATPQEEPAATGKKAKLTLEERQQDIAQKGRVTALNDELKGTQELIGVVEPAIARAEKMGQGTVNLKAELDRLRTKETGILQDLEDTKTLPKAEAVAREEKVSLRAATLQDIVDAGFKEGRAEVIKGRAAQVKEVATENGLTQADVRTLLKSKNIGLMGDQEFQNWLETGKLDKKGNRIASFREQAANLAEKKAGRAAVGAILDRKAIRKEQYIRAFHNLPPIAKMTVAQLEEYVKILGAYEKDDEALSPKRRAALETTPFKGSKTWRDVRERASQILDVPMESLVGSKADQFDIFRYDTALSERSPVHKVIVEGTKVAELRAAAQLKAFKDKLFDLGAKAFASRERGFFNGRLFAPTMREVMQFLEAENEDKGKLAAALTPQELEFALFVQESYSKAYDYLVQTGDLASSRFSDNKYFFHAKRPISEMVAGLAKGEKFTDVAKELLSKWKQDEVNFKVTDDTGKVLGLRKFFKQTLFRSGELNPSENVIRSTQRYFESFYKKQALDEMVPHLETLVMSLRSAAELGDEEAQARQKGLEVFLKHYLNAKKGHSILQSTIPQGGKVDASIRLLSNYVSLNAIAMNVPLQLASKVGEQFPLIQALGTRGRALAFTRSLTEQGKSIIAKYEHFTGETVLKQAFEPGRNIEDHLGTLMYGIISSNRSSVMQTLLLGSMTDEEFKSGTVSNERLAEIKTVGGRWIDVAGAKSVFGATSTGAALMKFHGWAAPIMRTTIKDLDDIQASLRGKKTLTPGEKALILSDVRRAAESAAVVAAVYSWAHSDDDAEDDSFLGKLRRYALRETTTLIQAIDPVMWVSAGPVAGFAFQLARNLKLLVTLAEYEKDTAQHDAGDLKGPPALKRQLTPALVKQFQDKRED